MWRLTVDTIADWMEDVRLFALSFWSELYLFRNELSTEKVALLLTGKLSHVWLTLKRQSLIVQLLLSFLILLILISLIVKLYVKLTKGKCDSKARLDGFTVLVTGANNGIGLETARDLARRGARVILACRNLNKGIDAAKDIMATTGNENLIVKVLDLASLQSVRRFAKEIVQTEERLDVLILNAGLALTKKYLTEDNLEVHMATNHLGHFLLTHLLMPLLLKTSATNNRVRIVVVSSVAHWWGKIDFSNLNSEKFYDASRIYGTTKLANLLFTKELARRLKSRNYQNIIINALHPGAVQTGLFRNIPYFGHIIKFLVGQLYYTPEEGAQTSIYLSVDEDVRTSGEYYADCRMISSSPDANDTNIAKGLWEKSIELVQLEPNELFI